MSDSQVFPQRATIRNITEVIASTEPPGLAGSRIDRLLADTGAPTRGAGNKRDGLFDALTREATAEVAAQRTLEFLNNAMRPANFVNDEQSWRKLRTSLNKVLATEGWQIDDAGKLTRLNEKARTFSDIESLTSSLREELQRRGTHDALFAYCDVELLAKSMFHATSEAAKSISDRIRLLTGFTEDGSDLFNKAFGTKGVPAVVRINALSNASEESEHKGFKNLLVGIHGHYRNPRSHRTRLGSAEVLEDFLDAFGLFSYVHRRLDGAPDWSPSTLPEKDSARDEGSDSAS